MMYIRFVIIIFFLSNFLLVSNDKIENPVAGDCYPDNAGIAIEWGYMEGNIDILLWDGTTKQFSLIDSVMDSTIHTYTWYPGIGNVGSKYRIKIQSRTNLNDYYFSDGYFEVTPHIQYSNSVNQSENDCSMIYPQPCRNELNIIYEGLLKPTVTIFDIHGNEMNIEYIFYADNIILKVENLPKGFYFVTLSAQNCYKSYKFIKQ